MYMVTFYILVSTTMPASGFQKSSPSETVFWNCRVSTVAIGTRSDAVPVSGQPGYCQATWAWCNGCEKLKRVYHSKLCFNQYDISSCLLKTIFHTQRTSRDLQRHLCWSAPKTAWPVPRTEPLETGQVPTRAARKNKLGYKSMVNNC